MTTIPRVQAAWMDTYCAKDPRVTIAYAAAVPSRRKHSSTSGRSSSIDSHHRGLSPTWRPRMNGERRSRPNDRQSDATRLHVNGCGNRLTTIVPAERVTGQASARRGFSEHPHSI
jgi:hypothetical protein